MLIKLIFTTGESTFISVSQDETISRIKEIIKAQYKYDENKIEIIYKSEILQDTVELNTLKFNRMAESCLSLTVKICKNNTEIKITTDDDLIKLYQNKPELYVRIIQKITQLPESNIIKDIMTSPETLEELMNMSEHIFELTYEKTNEHFSEILAIIKKYPMVISDIEDMLLFGQEKGYELSDSDREKLDRLVDLGFPYDEALEAYITCGRNLNETANYLYNSM